MPRDETAKAYSLSDTNLKERGGRQMRFWKAAGVSMEKVLKPYSIRKEKKFREWLAEEVGRKPELADADVMFQKMAYELRNQTTYPGYPAVILVLDLQGTRYKEAIKIMKSGRALEYRNVRFRKKSRFLISASVQTEVSHSQDDASEAIEHAKAVIRELRGTREFRRASWMCRYVFQLSYEPPAQSYELPTIYFETSIPESVIN